MRISPSEVKRIKATTEYNRIQQNIWQGVCNKRKLYIYINDYLIKLGLNKETKNNIKYLYILVLYIIV